MENYLLYEDENTKVEIDGLFHDFLKSLKIKYIKIEKSKMDIILDYTFQKLKETDISLKDKSIVLASQSLVVTKGMCPKFTEDFDDLDFAFMVLSISEKPIVNKEDVLWIINEHYKEQNIPFYIEIFDKPVFKTDGVVLFQRDAQIFITVFTFDEDEFFKDFD